METRRPYSIITKPEITKKGKRTFLCTVRLHKWDQKRYINDGYKFGKEWTQSCGRCGAQRKGKETSYKNLMGRVR